MSYLYRTRNWKKCHLSRINVSRCINNTLCSLLQIPRPCQCLMYQFLIHILVRILLFLNIVLLMIFILILFNLLPLGKTQNCTAHPLCLMLIFHHLFILLFHPFSHSIPKSVSKALLDSGWRFTMQEEMTAL